MSVRRWLFNLAAGVSLVLCVAIGVLWVRSARHVDSVGVYRTDWPQPTAYLKRSWDAWSERGKVGFGYLRTSNRLEPTDTFQRPEERNRPSLSWEWSEYEDPHINGGTVAGFAALHDVRIHFEITRSDYWMLMIPSWLPIVLLLLLPARWLYRFHKSRRVRRLGLCPTCGYDLRATPQRCPECGAVPRGLPRQAESGTNQG